MRSTRENIERLLGNASVENTKSDEWSSKSTEIFIVCPAEDLPSEAKTHLTNITNSEAGTIEAERCTRITAGRIIGLG